MRMDLNQSIAQISMGRTGRHFGLTKEAVIQRVVCQPAFVLGEGGAVK